ALLEGLEVDLAGADAGGDLDVEAGLLEGGGPDLADDLGLGEVGGADGDAVPGARGGGQRVVIGGGAGAQRQRGDGEQGGGEAEFHDTRPWGCSVFWSRARLRSTMSASPVTSTAPASICG